MVVSPWIGVQGLVLGKVGDMGCVRYHPDLPYCNRPWPTALFPYRLLRMGKITLGNFGNVQNPLIWGGKSKLTAGLIINSSRCSKRSFTWYSLKLVSSVQRTLISSLAADTSLWMVLYTCIELRQGMPWYNSLCVLETLPSMMLTESRSEQEGSVI